MRDNSGRCRYPYTLQEILLDVKQGDLSIFYDSRYEEYQISYVSVSSTMGSDIFIGRFLYGSMDREFLQQSSIYTLRARE